MTKNSALPDLACHLRRLLEAVKDACGVEGRRGWLAAPMALLMWIRTRRARKEAAMALEQFKALMEQLLVLLEDFRAGKLNAPATPEAHEPLHSSASSAARTLDRRERRGTQRLRQAPDAETMADLPPAQPSPRSSRRHDWIPAFAGMTDSSISSTLFCCQLRPGAAATSSAV